MDLQKETRVLVVEDDFVVSEMIRKRVEILGYTVVGEARNGQQAVEMTQSLWPDVILMDIEMPDMDGIEATRRIYESCPTPVVMLTAYDSPELLEQASEAGAGAYLMKLPRPREIERAITIAVARFGDMMVLRNLNADLQARNKELQEALAKVKILSGMLPICANCKKIRDDKGYWQDVAVYIRDHSEAEFSHGLCPDCAKELYPDFYQESDEHDQNILEVLRKLDWTNLEDILAATGLQEGEILCHLQNMVKDGQLRRMEVNGQSLYKLS